MRAVLASRRATLDRAFSAVTGVIGTSLGLQLVVMASGVLAARMLGVTDRGHLATLWLIVLIPAQLGTLGMPSAATYFVARDPLAARSIMRTLRSTALRQAAAVAVIQATTLAIVLHGESSRYEVAGLLTLAVLPPVVAYEYSLALLQGQQRFRAFNMMRVLPNSVYCLALAAAFVLDSRPGLITVVGIWAGATVVACVASLMLAATGLPVGTTRSAPASLRAMRRFGLKSVLGTATVLEQLQLDQAVVALVLAPAALGLYVTAVAFANLPRFVGLAIGMVAYPDLAGMADRGEALRRLWRYVLMDLIACGAIATALELGLGWLLPFFFGASFEAAVPVARILVLSGLLQSVRRVLADGARGVGQPGLATVAEISSWAVLGPCLLFLTPSFGLDGVAYALVAAPAVATLVLVLGILFRLRSGGGWRPSLVTLVETSGVADAIYVEGAIGDAPASGDPPLLAREVSRRNHRSKRMGR